MKHSESLIKFKLISEKFDFKEILNDGLKGKAITASILIFEVLLLFIFVTTSDFYHRYTYHNKVQTLLATDNKIELNNMYVQVVESGSKDSLFYIIVKSMEDPRKPLRASIASGFSSYSEDVQDTITKLFIKYQISIFSEQFLASRLIESNFNLTGFEGKALATNEKLKVQNAVSYMLKNTISKYDYSNVDHFLSYRFRFELPSGQRINDMNNTIRLFRNYFHSSEDSLWRDLQINYWIIDTLNSYYNKISMDVPEKPNYYEPTYDGPTYMSGVVIPYDGYGVLIGDYPKLYVIEGAEKDLGVYFQGYASKTDRTENVYSKVNGNTWDATVCEYATEEEYNSAQSDFSERQRDAYSRYNQEMKEYSEALGNYHYFKKSEPLIKKRISEIISSIQITVSQIKGA